MTVLLHSNEDTQSIVKLVVIILAFVTILRFLLITMPYFCIPEK